MDRAAAIMERTEHKVVQSKTRGRTVEARAKTWDDINKTIPNFASAAMPGDSDNSDDSDEASGELDSSRSKVKVKAAPGATASADAAAAVPLPEGMDDVDDDIL